MYTRDCPSTETTQLGVKKKWARRSPRRLDVSPNKVYRVKVVIATMVGVA